MRDFNCEGVLDFLTSEKKSLLNEKFGTGKVNIMPHEISGPLSISNSDAIAILNLLYAENLSRNYLAIYHICEPDLLIETVPFEQGFPSIPWFCSNCQEIVEDINELSFNIVAVTEKPIRFI